MTTPEPVTGATQDPRAEILALEFCHDPNEWWASLDDAVEVIARIDAADAAAGIRRVPAAELERLRGALEWTEENFRLAVNGKAVRDMAENLAENATVLGRGAS